MSDETKKTCKGTLALVLSTLALLISLASLGLSGYLMKNGSVSADGGAVVISKQYDKGRSLKKALDTKKPVIVFFYTDWCGFCQRFVPTYDEVSKDKKIKQNFAIAYVNCEKPENAELMKEYNVTGYPTVYVIDKDGNKTQLKNETFFNPDSKETIKKDALKFIGIDE